MVAKPRQTCRICGTHNLETVFDMGEIHPSAFLSADEVPSEKLPLELVRCTRCGLVQLAHSFDLDAFYRQYFYRSAINSSMVAALKEIADEAKALVAPEDYGVVCDIGANDGTSLSFYDDRAWIRVAYEPALNLGTEKHADYFINDYFNSQNYPKYIAKARIVTAIAMFYDLPDPMKFTLDVMSILADNGVFIIQFTDLKSMLELNAFDNIAHEHAEYYSSNDIVELMRSAGLEVFRILHNGVNGGSLRFYVDFKGVRPVEHSVKDQLESEARYFQSDAGSISAFAERVTDSGRNLRYWLNDKRRMGENVFGLAASTKGNGLLQYYGIDTRHLYAIGDLNPDKFGKFTVGTWIPIISEAEMMDECPDYLLVLAWGFLPYFLKRFADYMKRGGGLVVPLPEARLYRMDKDDVVYWTALKEVAYGD